MSVYFTPNMINQKIEHIWKTHIQANIQGGEKRSALYTWPRVRLENILQFTTSKKQRFSAAHYKRDIHNIWYFPIRIDRTALSAQAMAGQKVIQVADTAYRHFYDGRECILIDPFDWESYEVITIDTVDSAIQITCSTNLVATWPEDTLIFPLYGCRVKPNQSRVIKHLDIFDATITGEESFESARSFSYTLPTVDATAFPVYNSLHLFLTKPLTPVKEEYQHPFTLLGFLGQNTMLNTFGDTVVILSRQYLLSTRKNIHDVLNFFDAQQGRLGSFYTPTWLKDIIISQSFDALDTVLTVEDLYMTAGEIVGQHIYLQFADKTYVCREIVDMPSSTSITLDSAVGETVSDVSAIICSFLPKVRFNQDNIRLDYLQQAKHAKIDLHFRTLQS